MDFWLQSLQPVGTRKRWQAPFGLPFERGSSNMSIGSSYGRQASQQSVEAFDVDTRSGDIACSSGVNYTINYLRTISSDCLGSIDLRRPGSFRVGSTDDIAAQLNADWQHHHASDRATSHFNSSDADMVPRLCMDEFETLEESVDDEEVFDSLENSISDSGGDTATELKHNHSIKTPSHDGSCSTADSTTKCIDFEYLDASRPWEHVVVETLNRVPVGFTLPDPIDTSLILGDLRVIGRFYVQQAANERGIKIAPGITNSGLIELANDLGLYPLMYRLHLEIVGTIPLPDYHSAYLEYKREAKVRAKSKKSCKDVLISVHTRIGPDGVPTIEYFEGISLRLGRERDTIFRPLLHKLFKEFKKDIKQRLSEAGVHYSEMRKWKETQLCTALHVADHFVPGIWQTAVNVHFSKTKDSLMDR